MKGIWSLACLALLPLSAGCADDMSELTEPQTGAQTHAVALTRGLTPHFRAFLQANGYAELNFARDDLNASSFGGKTDDNDTVVNDPVIFIHGNSDQALGSGGMGWNDSIAYFLSHGYKSSELYATTWGSADLLQAMLESHSRANLVPTRKFVEAVLAYTGAQKVDVIAHSMGVTLARKVIQGGAANDGGRYSLGPALTSRVDTFVGIAGGNLGLTACFSAGPFTPACDQQNGFYPGVMTVAGVTGRSAFLNGLMSSRGYEGAFRYSIWSTVDEVLGYGSVVYGQVTPRIPGQTGERMFTSVPFGHLGMKNLTGALQLNMVKNHIIRDD